MGEVDVDDRTEPHSSAPAQGADSPDRRRGLRRALLGLGVLALVLALGLGSGVWVLAHRYGGNIERLDNVFAGLDEASRPAPPIAVHAVRARCSGISGQRSGTSTRDRPGPADAERASLEISAASLAASS